jgi:fumarate reductase subunit D
MYQPYPSSGQPSEPLRPRAPAPVLTAVKLMYAGAAVSAVNLIIGLAIVIVDIKAAARGQFLGHSLTAPQMRPLIITVWMVFSLVVIALWLGMARVNGQGRSWARILSTVLFGLATLQLRGDFTLPVSHAGFGVTVLYYGGTALFAAAWLVGAAAVWLLWRPASSAFFKPQGFTQAGHSAQPSSRIRSSSSRLPRHL